MINRTRIFTLTAFTVMAVIGGGCSKSQTPAEAAKQATVSGAPVSKWEGKLVRGPGATPEQSKVYLVQGGKRRWATSAEWLKQHGFKFPEEVIMISDEELASIPLGENIQ